jgi:DNA anti-recombination protein RmuC
MDIKTQSNTNTLIAWIGLVIAIIALVIAWTAYNRSGADLEAEVQRNIDQAVTEMNLRLARFEAAAELATLEARQDLRQNYAQLEQEIAQTRQDLRVAYQNAQREASQEWQEIERDFMEVERNVREGTANALDSLRALIANLRRNVEADN